VAVQTNRERTGLSWVRETFLCVYALLTYYRYRKYLNPLRLPDYALTPETPSGTGTSPACPTGSSKLSDVAIQEKAKASLASASAFLAFTVAVLVALAAWGKFETLLERTAKDSALWQVLGCAIITFILSYSVFWSERYISAASIEAKGRGWRYSILIISFLVSLFLLLGLPYICNSWSSIFEQAFPLTGALMVLMSAFFLLFSLEFYDSACGWRGDEKLHFHLAGLASHSQLLGVSLAFVGLSLSLCLLNFFVGCLLTAVTLLVLIVMTEIERELWDKQKVG
jgi:hypothetical protein